MNKKLLLSILLCFSVFSSFISLNAQWARTYGGSDQDRAYSIQQTSDGGYIAVGYTKSFGAGEYDFWVLKLFPNGDIDWQRTYGGGSDEDLAYSIQQTSDGGYIVGGYTRSFGAGESDLWVLKLFPNGDIDWQRTYGGILSEWSDFSSIQQTEDGGYIVVAHTGSFGAGELDVWVLKLTLTGEIEWQRTYGGTSTDYGWEIQQTSDGGYIVAGHTWSFGAGRDDAWILKLSSTGAIEWQRTYGGIDRDWSQTIRQTSDGGYILSCCTRSFGAGDWDFWILKLSSTGAIEWQRTYGGSDLDWAGVSVPISDGGYIVTSLTSSFGAGDLDVWVFKLSSTGAIEWQRTYGGSDEDCAFLIEQTGDGGYIVAGRTSSFGAGDLDAWVLKLTSTGALDSSCGFIGSSNAIVTYTNIVPQNTNVMPQNTYITPQNTDISPQDTDATVNIICQRSVDMNQFIEVFEELGEVYKPFDPSMTKEELLSTQEASLEAAEEAIYLASMLPGTIESRRTEMWRDLFITLIDDGFTILCFLVDCPIMIQFINPDCPLIYPWCVKFPDIKDLPKASTYQLFSFDLTAQVDKPSLEHITQGFRFVTDIPFFGFKPSFSIVEVKNIENYPEFGSIELAIEGVSVVPNPVAIDIKPGSFPNSINTKSIGRIPIAILSTAEFDAPTLIDKTSLTFGRIGDEESFAFCNSSDEDVNGDGFLDLVCHFTAQLTGFQDGDTKGILKGKTVEGWPIIGKDSVRIVH